MINFKITRLTVLIIALFFTASCINNNSMKPTDFKNTKPTMTIEQYFDGRAQRAILHDPAISTHNA